MRGDEPGVYIMSHLYETEASSTVAPRSHLENQTLKFVRQVNIGCRWALGFIHVRIGKCEVEGNDKPGIRFDSGVSRNDTAVFRGNATTGSRFIHSFLQRQPTFHEISKFTTRGWSTKLQSTYCYTSCPFFFFRVSPSIPTQTKFEGYPNSSNPTKFSLILLALTNL